MIVQIQKTSTACAIVLRSTITREATIITQHARACVC